MFKKLLERLLGLEELDEIYECAASDRDERSIFWALLRVLRLQVEISDSDLRRIPREGSVIVVANHPTGALDGIALAALLEDARNDVKTLSHVWFSSYPRIAERPEPLRACTGAVR